MCGICGILKFDGEMADRNQVGSMVAALRHRGPDAQGVFANGRIGLGHARLSIIDLAGGAQPMSDLHKKLWITFNGEIFNYIELRDELKRRGHRFLTESDTEVILNAYLEYGEACVKHFNGQWAFAIWDTVEQKLFLSRDRVGIRPLFYTQTPDAFLFSSEIKALFACEDVPREIDPVGMDQVFTFWATIPPRTAFKGIWQLPPGHSLTVKNDAIRTTQYWTAPYVPEADRDNRNEDAVAEELLGLLEDATRIRLRSDVPVGAYLSGGLDSTLITALVRRIADDRLRSFSIAFSDPQFDESRYQIEASAFLKTQHSTVSCSPSDIAYAFPDVVRHAEQPLVRTAPAPMFMLSRLVRDSNFKVVLTGEGADEFFGGYDIYKEAKIRRFWARNLQSKKRPLLLKRLYPYLADFQRQPAASLARFFRVSEQDLASPLFSHLPRWELASRLKLLLSDEFRANLQGRDALHELEETLPADFGQRDPFAQAEYLEATYFLPGYLLSSQGDRMAMAHSVEGRYPFLDYRVIEFAARVPAGLKLRVLNEKYLLKRACRKIAPASIVGRRKQPYRAFDGNCFFGAEAPSWVREALSPATVDENGVFSKEAVSTLTAKYAAGKASSVKDDMALVGVLSTQLLVSQFTNQKPGTLPSWTPQALTATSESFS